jgi:hypothetical protein
VHTDTTCNKVQAFTKRDSSTIRRRGGNIVSMFAFQTFTMIGQGGKGVKGYELNKGRIINGQKLFVLVIAGTTGFAVIGMHQFFGHLTAKQPGI